MGSDKFFIARSKALRLYSESKTGRKIDITKIPKNRALLKTGCNTTFYRKKYPKMLIFSRKIDGKYFTIIMRK